MGHGVEHVAFGSGDVPQTRRPAKPIKYSRRSAPWTTMTRCSIACWVGCRPVPDRRVRVTSCRAATNHATAPRRLPATPSVGLDDLRASAVTGAGVWWNKKAAGHWRAPPRSSRHRDHAPRCASPAARRTVSHTSDSAEPDSCAFFNRLSKACSAVRHQQARPSSGPVRFRRWLGGSRSMNRRHASSTACGAGSSEARSRGEAPGGGNALRWWPAPAQTRYCPRRSSSAPSAPASEGANELFSSWLMTRMTFFGLHLGGAARR